MMSRLLDALKSRFRTPQEAVAALGLDEAILDETTTEKSVVIAHDERPLYRDRRFTPEMAQDSAIVKDSGTHEGAVKAAATRAAGGRAKSDAGEKSDGVVSHNEATRRTLKGRIEAQERNASRGIGDPKVVRATINNYRKQLQALEKLD